MTLIRWWGGQADVSKLARSGGCFSNGQGLEEYAQDNCEVLASNGRAAESPSADENDHFRNHPGGGSSDVQAMDAEPPPYRARLHPATNEVIERHIVTINRPLQEGKALQEDVDNFNIFLDVYFAPQTQCTARERKLGLSRPNGAPWNTSLQTLFRTRFRGLHCRI